MRIRVISGGQCGVDQAALRAARAAGLETGGYAAKGWQTEEGPAPWLADYGLVECEVPGYPPRTRWNVVSADATLWIGDWRSPGGKLTTGLCRQYDKPLTVIGRVDLIPGQGLLVPGYTAKWLLSNPEWKTLNVAGNRESNSRGIGAEAEAYLAEVFRKLQEHE